MRSRSRLEYSWLIALFAAAATVGVCTDAYAADGSQAGKASGVTLSTPGETQITSDEFKKLQAAIRAQRDEINRQSEALHQQQQRLQALEQRLDAAMTPKVRSASYVVTPSPAATGHGGNRQNADQVAAGSGSSGSAIQGQEQPKPNENVVKVVSRQAGAGVLGKKGTFYLEPSLEYLYQSQNQLSIAGFTIVPGITVGNIDVRKVRHETAIAALTGRYNVTDRLQVDLKVPYVYRNDENLTRPLNQGASSDITTTAEGYDLGDIEFGAHYQLTTGAGYLPILVANVNVKTDTGTSPFSVPLQPSTSPAAGLEKKLPTGTGFWSVEGSATAIIPSDPVVFYGNLGYQWNIGRTITSPNINNGSPTDINPGDAVKASAGFGFAINDKASFNLGYEHDYIFHSLEDGQVIPDSTLQVGRFIGGVAYQFNDRFSLDTTVAIGATSDAPDADVLIRLPVKF